MNTFSRFSVLAPEVDLNSAHKVKTASKKDKAKKQNKTKDNENLIIKNTKIVQTIKKKKSDDSELQALAFGFGKSKNKKAAPGQSSGKGKIGNKNKNENNPQGFNSDNRNHDDDWRKRDEEFIKAENENSLREAILQSKLEFEEKKGCEKQIETNLETNDVNGAPKLPRKEKRKKEKPLTVSLSEFNSMEMRELKNLRTANRNGPTTEKKPQQLPVNNVKKEKFFKDVEDQTKRTLEMESRHEQYKEYRKQMKNNDNEADVKKLTSEIEKRDFEIQALRLEVDSLKNQLQAVKSRNKKLCEVISFSEMRSKGELVVQLDKVTKGRDEFSEEIARLTAELEQERTKVSHLTTELKKMQGKKRNADSSSK